MSFHLFTLGCPSESTPKLGPHDRFITIDSITFHYTEYPGNGPTVVLQHGIASSTYTWEAAARQLNENGYHVLALDLKGFGWSDKPMNAGYDVVSLMEDVNRWMNALLLTHTIFVGNSLGGAIAVLMSAKYPNRIDKMVLIDAGGYPITPPPVIRLMKLPLAHIVAPYIFGEWMVRKNLKEVLYDHSQITRDKIMAYYGRMCAPNALQTLIKTAKAVDFNPQNDIIKAAQGNQTKTLIIWGENDRWIPLSVGHHFRKDMPNASLSVIPQCGHIPQEEKPDVTVSLILYFVENDRR